MPIYRQSYRAFDGEFVRRFRWMTVAQYEMRGMFGARETLILGGFALIHFLLRVMQIVAINLIATDPRNPLSPMIRSIDFLAVDNRLFFDFIRVQAPLIFIICISAGARMICDDSRNNLFEVYFSKPLYWWDYLLGKFNALLIVSLGVTALPALVLLILHNMLGPSIERLQDTWWLPGPIIAFSLLVCVPSALAVLTSSSLFKSQRFAAAAVFMVLFANLVLGPFLDNLLLNKNALFIALPLSINRIGEALFQARFPIFTMHWGWSLLYVLVVCLGLSYILTQRLRRSAVAL